MKFLLGIEFSERECAILNPVMVDNCPKVMGLYFRLLEVLFDLKRIIDDVEKIISIKFAIVYMSQMARLISHSLESLKTQKRLHPRILVSNSFNLSLFLYLFCPP